MTMMVIPTDKDVPLIQDVEGTPVEIAARADAFFKTAELIGDAGGDVEPSEAEKEEARLIFSGSELAPQVPSSSCTNFFDNAFIAIRYFSVIPLTLCL